VFLSWSKKGVKSIKNKFKDAPSTAEDVLNSLVSQAAVRVVQNKVDYDDKKIEELVRGGSQQ